MSKIKGKNTKPEMVIRKFLFSMGFRFRIHSNKLPGKPDIVLAKYHTVICIHGCFWHGHQNCKYFKIPSTREKFWVSKINRTKQLDNFNKLKLLNLGWKIIEIWECALKPQQKEATQKLILNQLGQHG